MRVFLALLALTFATPSPAQTIAGSAYVTDGDTLSIGNDRIRLFGIDATELDQNCTLDGTSWPCGEAARAQLQDITANRQVSCVGIERDRHGRLVARCTADGHYLGATMVE